MCPSEVEELPEALVLAREVREQGAEHGPAKLYEAAGGNVELYRHSMFEASYIMLASDLKPRDKCHICGYKFNEGD